MLTNKKFIFLSLATATLVLTGCKLSDAGNSYPAAKDFENSKVDIAELEKNYENSVREILQPYFNQQSTQGIKDKILDLTAPAKYLDFHFNLVIGLEAVEQGQKDSDQAQVEEGLDKINQLISNNPWLE